jgi:hypothetical protein
MAREEKMKQEQANLEAGYTKAAINGSSYQNGNGTLVKSASKLTPLLPSPQSPHSDNDSV